MQHVITFGDVLLVGGALLGVVVVLGVIAAVLSAIGSGFSR